MSHSEVTIGVGSMEEWIAALSEAKSFTNGQGATTMELVAATGRSVKWVRDRLHQLQSQGRLGKAVKHIENLTGFVVPVPTFFLKAKSE